ncbi:MAG: sigma-54 dependent transcriptional regulator [bacterium]|nr:sigma-54 dependent transcriptional regulator [bacterium]
MTGPADRRVLVVDDEESIRWVLKRGLEHEGYAVATAADGDEALKLFKAKPFPVVFLDIRMPGPSGFEVMDAMKASSPDVFVVIITAQATMENAIAAMKHGAYDYMTKPFNIEEVNCLMDRIGRVRDLKGRVSEMAEKLREHYDGAMVGRSAVMQEVYKMIGRVAGKDVTVIIEGESGTGKELVARSIHYHSPRGSGPFIVINCAAVPRDLMESELFGHEKGAFTGAVATRRGKFEMADSGTVFLDEIGELDAALQSKLLRVLQFQEVERVGGSQLIGVDVRVIAATNVRLDDSVRDGRFREDLFYRLNVVSIRLPPLRERREDIPLLIDHFADQYARDLDVGRKVLSQEAREVLEAYQWPGNVRELENVLKWALVLSPGDTILAEHLPPAILETLGRPAPVTAAFETLLGERIQEVVHKVGSVEKSNLHELVIKLVERPLIKCIMRQTGGNQVRAAKLLGINRNTLRRKLQELGLDGEKKEAKR